MYSPIPAERAAAAHRVLLSEAAEAGLAEDVAARLHLQAGNDRLLPGLCLVSVYIWYLEGLVQQVQADRADDLVTQGVQLRLGLQQVLEQGRPLLLLADHHHLDHHPVPQPLDHLQLLPPPLAPHLLLLLLRAQHETIVSGRGFLAN